MDRIFHGYFYFIRWNMEMVRECFAPKIMDYRIKRFRVEEIVRIEECLK